MPFPPQTHIPHKPPAIQIHTDQYSHPYVSSTENQHAYSQGFSTPSIPASPFYATQPPVDPYQPDDDPRSPWSAAPYEAYDNHAVPMYDTGLLSRPSPSTSLCPELPLHAPTPLPGQPSSLLYSGADAFNGPPIKNLPSPNQFRFFVEDHPPHLAPQYEAQTDVYNPECHSRPAQSTFPTPSEMLCELSGNPHPPAVAGQRLPEVTGQHPLESKTEPARKARRRAMAQNIGFVPTDPCAASPAPTPMPESPLIVSPSDTISSHDKKRHYLACLEYYVLYLHQQLNLVGAQPISLQRVQTPGRGMSSRSIRTLLVHMGHANRRLNQQILAEEQRFALLRDSLSGQSEVQETQHPQAAFDGERPYMRF